MCRNALIGLLILGCAGPATASGLADPAPVPRPEHPRPIAIRPHWANLNGTWAFRFDPDDVGVKQEWFRPGAEGFDREIVVPFPWESELSGIGAAKDAPDIGWYRRTFTVPEDFADRRVWLRFEAVDYRADVWVNGTKVLKHEGGYTPFEADITRALEGNNGGEHTLVVRAFDPTDPSLPVGKQVGWYTTTSGIWQTVWLEARPEAYIRDFTIRTEIDPAKATIQVTALGDSGKPLSVAVRSEDETVRPTESAMHPLHASNVGGPAVGGWAILEVPVRDPKLWSPESPHLYDVTLELKDAEGKVVDEVRTYFGLRTIERGKLPGEDFERVFLNGKPIYLRTALDQSFNPQGIYTAPSDEFLKRDIELAREVGLNGLRIHIKTEEPRRLYWADRLGMLILQDLPNTWQYNETARAAWEKGMGEAIARDRNHPSIIAWVLFNETWGLGGGRGGVNYKESPETQAWVQQMMVEAREIDPTRLVEDNSACNYDHVEGTDLNSWHFYIDNDQAAREHVAGVVEQTHPGSPFNYCPGHVQDTAPLINSEYGAVSAGGGDRDISWGFRDLTTLLRKYDKIQGYVYTELTDIEWEHNGFADYDRSPKVFGYDAFVPGMTVADLQGADFVGYDTLPALRVKVGEPIEVPVFVSHFSDRTEAPTLRWWVVGHDADGSEHRTAPQERPATWAAYRVTPQEEPVRVEGIDEPFVGALALELVDAEGERIAANFVNLVVEPERGPARVERLADAAVALRFDPADYARARWSGPVEMPRGKAQGQGHGSFTYRLKVPESVAGAKPESVEVLLEVASQAGREQVDWPERVNPQDNPQTDARTWPTTVEVALNGQRLTRVDLADGPADARGVLSHLARENHGSFGYRVRVEAELTESVRATLAEDKPLELTLSVPEDAEHAGGLAVFGATTGRFPFDPTVILRTRDDLPADLGVAPGATAAIDTAVSRTLAVVVPGDAPRGTPTTWAYTTEEPGRDWAEAEFDDSGWKRGAAGFGAPGTPAVRVRTPWRAPEIWLRATVELPSLSESDLATLHLFHDEDVEVLINGRPLYRARGYLTSYRDIPLDADQKALFRPGPNVIAVHCRQTAGGQGIDVGLQVMKPEP